MTSYKITAVIEKDEDGWFARVPELDGCYTQGDSYDELMVNLQDVIRLHIQDRLERGEPIPRMESVSLTTLEVAV